MCGIRWPFTLWAANSESLSAEAHVRPPSAALTHWVTLRSGAFTFCGFSCCFSFTGAEKTEQIPRLPISSFAENFCQMPHWFICLWCSAKLLAGGIHNKWALIPLIILKDRLTSLKLMDRTCETSKNVTTVKHFLYSSHSIYHSFQTSHSFFHVLKLRHRK